MAHAYIRIPMALLALQHSFLELRAVIAGLSLKSLGAIHRTTFILEINMAQALSGVLRSNPQCNISHWIFI